MLFRRRFGWFSSHFSRVSHMTLACEFLVAYVLIGVVLACAYWLGCKHLSENDFSFNRGELCFPQALYFSFITQLTVGYGDFVPLGYARSLAAAQGVLGVIFVGVWTGVVVAKWFTAGSRKSICFAEWAGYSLREQRFFVLFVNRRLDNLVDVNINAIVKLSRYNPVPPGVNAPYIGRSAWTFGLAEVPLDVLTNLQLSTDKDGIKISISGTAGMTRCTNWHKYLLHKIWVLPDRDYYWDEKFEEPRFDKEFSREFKSPQAPGTVPLLQFLQEARQGRPSPENEGDQPWRPR